MSRAEWMNGICLIWSRGRLISPCLSIGDDRYLNLSTQKRPTGRNLGGNRSVRRSGTTSKGTVVLVSCLRMRKFPLTLVLTIFVGINELRRVRWIPDSSRVIYSCQFPQRASGSEFTILPYYSLSKMSKNGNTLPLFKILFLKNIWIYLDWFFFALFKSKIAV